MSYYKCIEQLFFDETIGNYITYGIEITEGNRIISDISCNKERVNEIVRLINKHQVSPIHITDVLENLISA